MHAHLQLILELEAFEYIVEGCSRVDLVDELQLVEVALRRLVCQHFLDLLDQIQVVLADCRFKQPLILLLLEALADNLGDGDELPRTKVYFVDSVVFLLKLVHQVADVSQYLAVAVLLHKGLLLVDGVEVVGS